MAAQAGTQAEPQAVADKNQPAPSAAVLAAGGTSVGVLVPADVEEAVKREIESATGSRLAQVEGALLELSRKQAELESREKQLNEISGACLSAPTSPTNTALVPGAHGRGYRGYC